MHHGIKGQKWGVRRYQNSDGSYTSAGKKRRGLSKKTINNLKKAGAVLGTTALVGVGVYALKHKNTVNNLIEKNAETKMSELSETSVDLGKLILEKKARYVGYRQANDLEYYRKAREESKRSGYGIIAHKHSIDEDVKAVNPFFGQVHGDIDYFGNCSRCSLSYEMRRRGLSVRATGLKVDSIGTTHAEADKMFGVKSIGIPNFNTDKRAPKTLSEISKRGRAYGDKLIELGYKEMLRDTQSFRKKQNQMIDRLEKQCEQFGPNSRGEIGIFLYNGAGHSMAFECDSGGKVTFIESQAGLSGSKTSSFFKNNVTRNISPYLPMEVRRTDNAPLNYDYIRKHNIVEPA